MDVAKANRIPVGSDDMDTPETVSGKRERAPVGGAMDSDTPTRPLGTKYRAGDLHLAFVADKEVVQRHVQWRHFERKVEIDAQSGRGPVASPGVDSGGAMLAARVAGERNRVLAQELTEEGERAHADPVLKARKRESGNMEAV